MMMLDFVKLHMFQTRLRDEKLHKLNTFLLTNQVSSVHSWRSFKINMVENQEVQTSSIFFSISWNPCDTETNFVQLKHKPNNCMKFVSARVPKA